MPPRQDTQPQTNEEVAALVAQQMAAVLPNVVTQIHQIYNNNSQCNFKTFNSAKPLKFYGSEGATVLLQWFESIESTFRHVQCPNEQKVDFALSVFQRRALTWWNGIMRDRGAEVAMELTWEEFKDLMKKEFCPRSEIHALENEFYYLKQDSGENRAYTDRFEQLSLLCPIMVTPLDRAIEKYIDGLPDPVQDIVTGSQPATLREAKELAVIFTDSQVRKGKLSGQGDKKQDTESVTETLRRSNIESSKNSKKRKASKNFAIPVPAPLNSVPFKGFYRGKQPWCNHCNYHHASKSPCRQCTLCGLFGYLAVTCRIQNQAAPTQTRPRACFNCGDLNHFKRNYPKLANANGRAFNINEAQANDQALMII
ncbi:uncharacterized protein LOC110866470 [Helianthus annuus]|uniref:uncharacterized protein LOC110866470 n=1 Tax=Helianthus annuus TaxID=4232 RepID=UPI000B8F2B64|nr:uncharacterized protein LOC110866470 [Helianthus annuus]